MTVLAIPEATVSVGGTSIATENLLSIYLHLGCTKEVSNFEVIVDNSNPDYHEADYSPGGDKEFTKGNEVIVKCTRGTISGSTKALLTGTLESLEYVDQAEDYQYKDIVILRGRCKGWQLFARKFNGDLIADTSANAYQEYKRTDGEAESMIAYLIDNYTETPLSHIRVTDAIASNAAASQKYVIVADGTKFTAGDLVKIYDDATWEYNKISSVSVNTLTMVSNLINAYTTAANGIVGLDLIRDSNTTYTKMEYSYETIFDIIKFISDTASTSGGVIGYDSRVEYDGKYAWLPRGHVTESNFDLTAEVQLERYIDDATRIKNKITIFGKADKPYPLDVDGQAYSDAWTDLTNFNLQGTLASDVTSGADVVLTDATGFANDDYVRIMDTSNLDDEECQIDSIDGNTLTMKANLTNDYFSASPSYVLKLPGWFSNEGFTISEEITKVLRGSRSVKHNCNVNTTQSDIMLMLKDSDKVDMDTYPNFTFFIYLDDADFNGNLAITLYSGSGWYGSNYNAIKYVTLQSQTQWQVVNVKGGTNDRDSWDYVGANFDWTDIWQIRIVASFSSSTQGINYIDGIYFWGKRWGGGTSNAASDGFAEDSTSQSTYGTKEYVVISDMLLSDKECESKAQGLLAFYKNPRTVYELESETLDWGDYPIYVGDKISIDLTPLGITGDKRVDSVDIHLTSIDHKLIVTFILDNTPPREADYLYNLSKKVRQLERAYIFIR